MNQGIFKLVYSKVLNMYVPASEAVRSRGAKSGKRIRKHAKNLLCFALIGNLIYAGSVWADPAGLIPGTLLVPGTQAWQNATITGSTTNSMTITQTAPKAILDWQKLNLNPGELLQFNQQGQRTWSALNRIHDLNASLLNGNVQADGNVYFINTNGIIFGKNAQFNVGSLYAGTLDITEELFKSGFIDNSEGNPLTKVFEGAGGSVIVQQGALINAANGGKVLLFAPTVENSGIINTPDGQTILAAGKTVYLASSKDPAGFLVEVDSGGTATNLGKIVAERGNITMMGLAVNQAGTLSATTSVRANGSIRLLAQDGVSVAGGVVTGARNGIVTLATGSVTEVKPEYDNKEETIASQAFTTSDVKIEASLVDVNGKISAKGGNVTINALNPASAELVNENPNGLTSRIYLGKNATIDVSGVDAVAPMSRNQLEIQLFSDQLKDAPILRDGGLFKDTVYVDARKGTELFDIAPFLALKGVTVAEKMTKAGTITLSTPNDLITEKGSVLNVSGGSSTFEAGVIKETNLYYNGKLVPISEAKPGIPYDKTADLYTVKDDKWGVIRSWDLGGGTTQGWGNTSTGLTEAQLKTTVVGTNVTAYIEGDDAGTLDLTVAGKNNVTKNLLLAGQVLANTKVGAQQEISQTIPEGGKFIASANDLLIAKNANELAAGFSFNQKLSDNFQSSMSTDIFAQGFNEIDLTKVSKLTVNDSIQLNPNGNLVMNREGDVNKTQINADIIAPGSSIKLGGATTVADGVTISTAGTFTNDRVGVAGQYTRPAAINGGSIEAGLLNLGKNVTLDASAGAWVDNKAALHEGEAGDITFASTAGIDDSVKLQSYGFKQGGNLTLSFFNLTQRVDADGPVFDETGAPILDLINSQNLNVAGNANVSATDIDVAKSFFTKGGFSKYDLSAFNVNIGDNTAPQQEIYSSAQTLSMDAGFANQTGGQAISAVSSLVGQPDASRKPVSLSFSASKLGGVLNLAENTTLRTDRGGSVGLEAGKQVNVLGDIVTPSGKIDIKINDKDTSLQAYDPTQAVFIGANANLSAIGSSISLPDSQSGLIKAQVFNAGNITIDAPKGAVVVKEGAVLDVSGTSVANDTKTVAGYTRETLHGDAGTIKLSANDGLLLDGSLKGAATGTGRAGTLDVGFTSTKLDAGAPILTGNREFTVTQQKQLVAQNYAVGDALQTAAGGAYTETSADTMRAGISAEQVQQGGFANLKVKSFASDSSLGLKDSIQLENGLDLQLAGNLKLETPQINIKNDGFAKLNASHITLKSPNSSVDNASIAAGEGKLTTQSKQLYIDGLIAIAGVKETSINTTLDISGQGTQIASSGLPAIVGGLVANGDINLTARQIYPNTAAKLSFEAVGDNSKITVKSNGVAAKPVLSAGGTLSLTAANVVQSGTLTAPFGQIIIDATKSAKFTAGSVTSVSANNQIIPYGTTATGGQFYNQATGISTPLPEKAIIINSANVDLQKNAVLDLSAGGDMFAYEFVSGIGGSKDVLDQTNTNTYAVIPNLGQDYAPFDQLYSDSSSVIGVGQSVFLTAVPGLATGTYTLLPARYALVPGAFLVEAGVASNLLPTQIAPQLDGAALTTGYRADLGTGARDANWSTFKVTDGAIFRPAAGTISKSPSQYILTSANTFFANPNKTDGKKVSLPQDVGRLSIDAAKLAVDGVVVGNKVNGGAGLNVDISSSNIRVVNNQDLLDTDSLQLTAASINALNAESLLLGGSRELQDGVVNITTAADTVSIENNSSNVIKTPEFIAAAKDNITVKTGAAIDTGVASKTPAKTALKADGDGALLALSSRNDIGYSRTGGSPTSIQGELNIEAGSTLKAGNSVVLDATKSGSLAGNVTLQDGGSATLGASRILIGDAPIDIVGLNVNAGALAALGQLKALTLNSYNNIDTFGTVNFGNSNLDLTMNSAGVVGHLANGETATPVNATPSIITAKTFTLKNTQGAKFADATDPSGRGLEINAATVKLDGGEAVSGKTQIAGFTKLDIQANEIRVANKGEASFNVAETKLTTDLITADTAAEYKINTSEKLEITRLGSAAISTNKGFGAKLDIAAKDLTVASNIDLSSGKLALTATNDLNIATGTNLTATSTANTFYDRTVHAPAGSVTLTSTTGNVHVNTGAVVDVTSQGEANAGMVKVLATSGTANIAGDLKGAATGSGKGGVLDVDVKTLADLSATNSKAVGFSEGRQYRVRTGDVAITGKGVNALSARETIVSADAGNISVTGDIIATAPKNSRIGLYAGNGVTLESTANLEAKSTKAGEEGGKVDIETTAGSLDFKMGSKVDTSAGAGGKNGKVYLGAARTADNLDINVANMGTTFTGTRKINIGGLDSVETNIVNSASQTDAFDKAEVFMQSVIADGSKGLQRLGLAGDSRFAIVPVVEFKNTNENVSKGNLTLADTFNLHTWRFDPVTGQRVTDTNHLFSGKNEEDKTLLAGVLNLRAKGDVLINATLSDSYSTAELKEVATPAKPAVEYAAPEYDADGNEIKAEVQAADAEPATGVQGIESWSYNIVAGADFNAANPLTTQKIATLDPSISAAKAIATIATIAIANIPNSQVKLVSGFPGYKLADAPIVAIKVNSIPTTINASAGSSTRLNVANTGEKELVKSNGAAVKKSDLAVGVTYLAKYDAASGKYKLVDDTPDVMLANNIGIRTGTGAINIAAAGDLVMVKDTNTNLNLRKSDAVIYTVGQQASALAGFGSPDSQNPLYLTDGGDINIAAKGNIVGGEPASGRQLVNHWLFRQGGEGGADGDKDTTWWVRPDVFKQSLATMGGGDININAGGSISNFSASAATTGRYDTNSTTIDPITGKLVVNSVVNGGGDVTVKADGDINNGVYFVAKGDGEINAGGSIQKQGNTFGTVLALQDGKFNVTVGKNAYIETTINPTLVSQSTTNATQGNSTGVNSYFNSYSPQAAVNLSSLLGNAEYGGISTILGNATGLDSAPAGSLKYSPSNLQVVSHNGDVTIGDIKLLPSPTGDLKVLAANNVGLGNVLMSDADPTLLPSVDKPISQFSGFSASIVKQLATHSAQLLHKNDAEPVLIVAQKGSISPTGNLTTILPKAAKIVAGKDINGLKLDIQNNNPSDISLIKAGNDIKVGDVTLGGPGELLIQAGRNIDLTNTSADIFTTGNSGLNKKVGDVAGNSFDLVQSNNPALPVEGASITLQAGLGKGANVQGYIDQYISPTGAGPAALLGDAVKLAEYRAATGLAVTEYMRKITGNSALSDAQALAQFNTTNLETKTIFANRHLTSELIASAKSFAKVGNHDRGNSAIAALFPSLNQGDILLYASKVSTNSGGSIDLIAPSGLINAGSPGQAFKSTVTVKVTDSAGKDVIDPITGKVVTRVVNSGEIGIITEKGGEIRAIANGDFQVNQSKLITQFGSDIAIWSTTGTIDAGRGSKTATSVPERIVLTDADGNTTVEVRGVAAGSGIRAQTYDPDGPNGPKKAPKKGNVYLTAPRVDAGEAGIEAGDLLIVAPIVLNATNIQVSGTSSGVPVAATSSLAGVSAGLSPDSVNAATEAVAQSVAQSANQQAFVKPKLPSIISVDVISIGN